MSPYLPCFVLFVICAELAAVSLCCHGRRFTLDTRGNDDVSQSKDDASHVDDGALFSNDDALPSNGVPVGPTLHKCHVNNAYELTDESWSATDELPFGLDVPVRRSVNFDRVLERDTTTIVEVDDGCTMHTTTTTTTTTTTPTSTATITTPTTIATIDVGRRISSDGESTNTYTDDITAEELDGCQGNNNTTCFDCNHSKERSTSAITTRRRLSVSSSTSVAIVVPGYCVRPSLGHTGSISVPGVGGEDEGVTRRRGLFEIASRGTHGDDGHLDTRRWSLVEKEMRQDEKGQGLTSETLKLICKPDIMILFLMVFIMG